ncbi:class I SAM-dependent DNA methyltransferase [Cyanobium sp. Candia 9D4]|uniref:DNA methyltransferase n=1 Tax=Cyanobium sp. Candia 9D4 TaxID=2823707 RepID=UPI0020CC0BC4|nr:DNA methyltransferase [Cyanobium sp. Candia 9D4]MCP9932445.1 class I SAM-dependent DNA methyltransferase [Cyanobium sp. Candia 9D4]
MSWDEIKKNAAEFVADWKNETSEMAEAQTFWNEFFHIFGRKRREVASFEKRAQIISSGKSGRLDLFWRGVVAAEHKSAGEDIDLAEAQLFNYSIALEDLPQIYVISDFRNFRVIDGESNATVDFPLAKLLDHITLFAPIAGYQTRRFNQQEQASHEASELLGLLHDRLEDSGYKGHPLRVLIVRLLFCVFADDTNVWRKGLFQDFLEYRTAEDGRDLGSQLNFLFQILNQPEEDRQSNLDEDLALFPYINGGLFGETIPIANFSRDAKLLLLKASEFNWSSVSPVIFGSLFQSVKDDRERRQFGEHYTSEADILKVVDALFMNKLRERLRKAGSEPVKLKALHTHIASLRFLDPAAGCGNFLAVAYRGLRALEREILVALHSNRGKIQRVIDIKLLALVKVDQFYGIEQDEFPARIAETAMYLVDHLENLELATTFGQYFARFPIKEEVTIRVGNALRIDWNEILPSEDSDFVLGNPPFGGHRYRTKIQSQELKDLWGRDYNKLLDYVTGWYRKAADYAANQNVRIAFVSTNSICQGEQTALLWGPLLSAGYRMDFAYQTFEWSSEARGKANVHVVIVSFSHKACETRPSVKLLYIYDPATRMTHPEKVESLSPYLIPGPEIVVPKLSSPLCEVMTPIRYGSLPSDGGGLVVKMESHSEVDQHAMKYLRRYVGSSELVKGLPRWCLWMPNGPDAQDVKKSDFLRKRLELVRRNRSESENPDTRELANVPYRFFHISAPTGRYMALPAQVGDSRRWYTPAYLDEDTIPSNTLYWTPDPHGHLFAILSSEMFMSWLRGIGGKIKSDPRIGKSVYNSFPLGDPGSLVLSRLAVAGKELSVTRERYYGKSLADLYEADCVPADVVAAHKRIDSILDRYMKFLKRAPTHVDRLQFLLKRYSEIAT